MFIVCSNSKRKKFKPLFFQIFAIDDAMDKVKKALSYDFKSLETSFTKT